MRLPESKIEEIRSLADITDVVGEYVTLKPAGRNFKGLSPFTNEKTPSFNVSPEKQIYKCFSSGKGGNVFTFIMEMEKLGFIDAVKLIAKRVGIDLSEYDTVSGVSNTEQTAYDQLAWAAKFFHAALNAPEGQHCLKYFLDRGLSKETISRFGLGYSFDAWDKLYEQSKLDKIPADALKEFGLIGFNEKRNSYYDTFRGRAMFPIFSPAGKVLGFGGRILTKDKETAKYINSPESRLYEKSKILYAMNLAKDSIRRRDEAILVEGYMDVISLHQAGIENAVASSGTSLTPQQIGLIGRTTKNVLFIYDGDKAGLKAMMRGIDLILEAGLGASVVSLPDDHDPDSFVRAVGGDEFRKYADAHRVSFLDFKLGFHKSTGGFDSPARTTESVRDLVSTLAKISDGIEREVYLRTLSDKTDVSFGSLQKELTQLLVRAEKRAKQSEEREAVSKSVKPAIKKAVKPATDANDVSQPAAPDAGLQPDRVTDFLPEQDAETSVATQRPEASDAVEQVETVETVETVEQTARQKAESVPVAERTFLRALFESTYHGTTVIEFVLANLDILTLRHLWSQQLVAFVLERYKKNVAAEPPYEFEISNELNYLDDGDLRNFVSGLLMEAPISKRWTTETPTEYARRCITSILDAMKKMILQNYDEALTANYKEIEVIETSPASEETLAELPTLFVQRNDLMKQKLQAAREFDSAIKRLFR